MKRTRTRERTRKIKRKRTRKIKRKRRRKVLKTTLTRAIELGLNPLLVWNLIRIYTAVGETDSPQNFSSHKLRGHPLTVYHFYFETSFKANTVKLLRNI